MLTAFGQGWVTADPQSRQVGQNGNVVANVTVAFRRSHKQGDEWREETAFILCRAWGKTAERIAADVRKGDLVSVEGYMATEKWTGRDGSPHSTTVLRIAKCALCVKPRRSDGGQAPPAPPARAERPRPQQQAPAEEDGSAPPRNPPVEEGDPSGGAPPYEDDDAPF